LMPRIAASGGLFFVAVRVIALVRGGGGKQGGRIMDIGFSATEDTMIALRRFAQASGALIVLVFGILLLG